TGSGLFPVASIGVLISKSPQFENHRERTVSLAYGRNGSWEESRAFSQKRMKVSRLWSAVASAARHRFGFPISTEHDRSPKRRRRFALPAHSTWLDRLIRRGV